MRKIVGLVLSTLALITPTPAAAEPADCDRGEFCLWTDTLYTGDTRRMALSTTNPGECWPVRWDARSFVNQMTRQVIVYQSRECSTEGEFETYPGGGTYVPIAPFVVRAIQIVQH